MRRFTLRHPFVKDVQQQQNNEALLQAINDLAQFYTWGDGVPADTPDAPQVRVRRDGSPGAAVYAFDGTNWQVLA